MLLRGGKNHTASQRNSLIFFCIQAITFYEGEIHFLATQTGQSKCAFDLQIKINLPIDFLSFNTQRTLQEVQKYHFKKAVSVGVCFLEDMS